MTGRIVGGLVLIGLALLTWRQAAVWRSDEALWRGAETVRGHVNHRAALLKEGRWLEAIHECEWLLTTTLSTPQQRIDIRRVCFGPR